MAMATLKSQDSAPASSLSGIFGICAGCAKSLGTAFHTVKDRIAPTYRERLSASEQRIYDDFYARRQRLSHQVFLVITPPVGGEENTFESFASAKAALARAGELKKQGQGQYAFIALDLTESFESQWTKGPDGTDRAIDSAKINAVSRTPGVFLTSPVQDRKAAERSFRR
jgi:hypothetical protein